MGLQNLGYQFNSDSGLFFGASFREDGSYIKLNFYLKNYLLFLLFVERIEANPTNFTDLFIKIFWELFFLSNPNPRDGALDVVLLMLMAEFLAKVYGY